VNDADIFLAVVISICVTVFHLLESVALIIYLIVLGIIYLISFNTLFPASDKSWQLC